MTSDPTDSTAPPQDPLPRPPHAAGEAPATIDSRNLFQGNREVLIDHAGEIYRLRLTRNGKLILHK